MKQYQLNRFGIEGLALVDAPDPTPGPSDVLVRWRAWSLNYRVVVDIGGAATLNDAFRAVRMGGAVALVGLIGGPKAEINVPQVFSQLIRIRGIGVGSRADLLALLRAIETQRIRPVIDREFAFNEVNAAFRHFKAGAHFGKVVIRAA